MAGKGTEGFLQPFKHFATSAIHAGQEPEQWRSGAVVPPISVSTTFKQRAPGDHTVSGAATGAPNPHCGLGHARGVTSIRRGPAGGTGGSRCWEGEEAAGAGVSPRGSSWANASISFRGERGSGPGRRWSLLSGAVPGPPARIPCPGIRDGPAEQRWHGRSRWAPFQPGLLCSRSGRGSGEAGMRLG